MSKSRICTPIALILTLFLVVVWSRQSYGQARKKIQVEVCVLNDEAKYVEGVQVHISPYGKADPPMQTTNGDKCLQFEIEVTTSFEVAFWHNGRIIGVQRALAGFENAHVRVNYKRLSTESQENALLRLVEIRTYTNSLRDHSDSHLASEAVNLLKGPKFKKQVEKIASDSKDTNTKEIHKDILNNISKLPSQKKE